MPILSDPNEKKPITLSQKLKEKNAENFERFERSTRGLRSFASAFIGAELAAERSFNAFQRSRESLERIFRVDRQALLWFVGENKKDWEKTGNPLYAFNTFLICRENHISIPKWVFDYFSDIAVRIMEIDPDKNTRPSEEVYKALAMNHPGRGNYFSEFLASQENRTILTLIDQYKKEYPNLSMEKLFMKVGRETRRSWQVIRTLYYKKRD